MRTRPIFRRSSIGRQRIRGTDADAVSVSEYCREGELQVISCAHTKLHRVSVRPAEAPLLLLACELRVAPGFACLVSNSGYHYGALEKVAVRLVKFEQ